MFIYVYHYLGLLKPCIHANTYIIIQAGCLLREETLTNMEGFRFTLYGNYRAIWPRQRTNPGISVLYQGVKVHRRLAMLASMLTSRAIWWTTYPVIGVNYRGAEVTGTLPRFLGVDALDKMLGKQSCVCPRATVPLVCTLYSIFSQLPTFENNWKLDLL